MWSRAEPCFCLEDDAYRVSRTASHALAAPLSTMAAMPAIDQASGTSRYTTQPASIANPICEYRNGAIVTGVVRA